jgi:hypothetical protein
MLSSQSDKSTHIIRWNSAQSRLFTMQDFELQMRKFDFRLNIFPFSTKRWQNIHAGDTVYMVHEGEGQTGIVMRGTVHKEPHSFETLCPAESDSRIIAIHIDQIMHPEKAVLPNCKGLEERWGQEEWKGWQNLITVDKQTAEELDQLFHHYLLANKEQFALGENNGVAITCTPIY